MSSKSALTINPRCDCGATATEFDSNDGWSCLPCQLFVARIRGLIETCILSQRKEQTVIRVDLKAYKRNWMRKYRERQRQEREAA